MAKKKNTRKSAADNIMQAPVGILLAKVVINGKDDAPESSAASSASVQPKLKLKDSNVALVVADIWTRLQSKQLSFSCAQTGIDLKTGKAVLDEDLMLIALVQYGYKVEYAYAFIAEFKEICDDDSPIVTANQQKCKIFTEINAIPDVVDLMEELDGK